MLRWSKEGDGAVVTEAVVTFVLWRKKSSVTHFWKLLWGPRLGVSSRASWRCHLSDLSKDIFFPQIEKEGATLRLQAVTVSRALMSLTACKCETLGA
ncbi:uncharacterized protein isoform X3 [Macaca fascicularis]|uniref:uncharacterized protein isoform X3 n=1 Tax=Macaca fascicularis TaxID=9541 RepID=UPI003D15593B